METPEYQENAPLQGGQYVIDFESGEIRLEVTCPFCGHEWSVVRPITSLSSEACGFTDCEGFAPYSEAKPLGWGDAYEACDAGEY